MQPHMTPHPLSGTPRPLSLARRLVLAASLCGLAAALGAEPARADRYVLKDGTVVDGRTLREKGEFVYVKTLTKTHKLVVAEIAERTDGPSPLDEFEQLTKAASAAKKDAAAQWALCRFLRAHADGDKKLTKQADKLLAKVLQLDPDHSAARTANGDVLFEDEWVKKSELERRKAEAERRRVTKKWVDEVGVPVVVEESDHFTVVWGLEDETDHDDHLEHLEQGYELLCELFAIESLWPGKSVLVDLPDRENYERYVKEYAKSTGLGESWVKIATHEGSGGAWRQRGTPRQIRWPNQGIEALHFSEVHMLGHIVAWRRWTNGLPPAWIPEGLGQWVEYAVLEENIASCIGTRSDRHKGGTSDDHGKGKEKGKGGREEAHQRKEQLLEALGSGEFPPMRKFLGMELGDYTAAEEGGALGLVEFLLEKDRAKFPELFAKLNQYGAQSDKPWEVYGYDLIEDLEKEWKEWVLSAW